MRLGRHAAAALVGAITLSTGLSAQTVQINGAAATFPNPIYSKWFSEYNKLHPNIQISYQPLGSGAGIRQLTTRTVFFGASEAPMTKDQQLAAPGKILQNSTGAFVRASVEAVTAAAPERSPPRRRTSESPLRIRLGPRPIRFRRSHGCSSTRAPTTRPSPRPWSTS